MSTQEYVGWAIALLFVCSVICRAGYMLFGHYIPLSENVRRALRYAPAAALTAILVPEMLPFTLERGPYFDYRLLAGIVAILVFMKTRSAVMVIVSGMVALWALRWAFN